MRLVAGLGNPGRKYARTRHNIGFLCLEAFASKKGLAFKHQKKIKGSIARHKDTLLLKPSTYMNLSGESVKAALDYYRIPLSELVVIHDDLDLGVGRLRLREKGGTGGHKGLSSILAHVGEDTFKRIRFGIGDSGRLDASDYVLSRFVEEEGDTVIESIREVTEIIEALADDEDFTTLMNRHNVRANEHDENDD